MIDVQCRKGKEICCSDHGPPLPVWPAYPPRARPYAITYNIVTPLYPSLIVVEPARCRLPLFRVDLVDILVHLTCFRLIDRVPILVCGC